MDTYKLKWTQLQQSIFSLLSDRAGEKLSQREIAILLNVSPTAVGKALKNLKEFIILEKTKTIHFISFNRDNQTAKGLKRAENLKNIILSGFSEFLEQDLAGATIILFGSYAKGEDTKNSDVDIAVIGRKEKRVNLTEYEKALNRNIHMNFYGSWKDIHKHLRNNILNGIILQGSVEL